MADGEFQRLLLDQLKEIRADVRGLANKIDKEFKSLPCQDRAERIVRLENGMLSIKERSEGRRANVSAYSNLGRLVVYVIVSIVGLCGIIFAIASWAANR